MRIFAFILLLNSYAHAQQPNIIYIMSDDHDRLAISAYDKTFIQTPNIDRLANEGIIFKNAFVANSICAPARATLLTGQHSHKNGHIDNILRFDSSKTTMPKLLQQTGYQTAIVGKWHLKSYPTGFDYWNILPGQGLYFEPRFIDMNGDTSSYKGYATDVITDEALHWLDRRNKQKPFLLLLHHKAPHRYFFPPLKYIQLFHNKTFPEPPTLTLDTTGRGTAWKNQTMSILPDMRLCSDLKVDPKYVMDIPGLRPDSAEIEYYNSIMARIPKHEIEKIKEIYKKRGELLQRLRPSGEQLLRFKYQWYMQDYMACVASIDENVGRVLDYLDKNGLSNNTVVMYTSDQGMYMGQNGWFDKRFMYDVSMRTPLLIRWSGKIKARTETNTLVQNIDLAPTLLDLAGADIPKWMQGLSLKKIFLNTTTSLPRNTLYYHFYESYADHTVLPHLGVRNDRYKLIYFYTVDEWELYDIKQDPHEIQNVYSNKKYNAIAKMMREELEKARNRYDDHEKAGVLK
jgi:arylsulfatase A-like enzyme